MEYLKKYPYFLFLLVLFFCLHGSIENFGSLTLNEVTVTGLQMLMTIIFLFVFVFLVSRKLLFSSLVVFFISTCYYFFGAFHDFVRSISFFSPIKSYLVFVPFILLLLSLVCLFIKKRQQLQAKITLYVNILLLLYCMIDLVSILSLVFQTTKKTTVINFEYSKVIQKPDVYFLLFDSYPGQKSLQDSFNFSNEKFDSFLVEHSFKSLPIQSNYNVTHFSMASMFNMNYIPKNYSLPNPTQKDELARQKEIENASVFEVFDKMGYDIYNYSIFDLKNKPSVYTKNHFLNTHTKLLNDKVFPNRVLRDLSTSMPESITRFFPSYYDNLFYGQKFDNINLEKYIYSFLNEKKSKPSFLYAHFLMPHAPYYLDSLGNDTDKKILLTSEVYSNKEIFLSYLKYTNTVIENIILAIKQKNPNAIIIFMSDHGFNLYKTNQSFVPEHFNNTCAVYFPNNFYGKKENSITNVNFFPYFFNTQYNQQLAYLTDSSFSVFKP